MTNENVTEASTVDPYNNCSQFIRLTNFDLSLCTGINDDYRLITKNDTREWKSFPWNCYWTNERRAYISLRSPHNCIWWENDYRHWWIGDCEKRGNNYGLAYLEPDENCPHDGFNSRWRRAGTAEILTNGKIVEVMLDQAMMNDELSLGKLLFFN